MTKHHSAEIEALYVEFMVTVRDGIMAEYSRYYLKRYRTLRQRYDKLS